MTKRTVLVLAVAVVAGGLVFLALVPLLNLATRGHP